MLRKTASSKHCDIKKHQRPAWDVEFTFRAGRWHIAASTGLDRYCLPRFPILGRKAFFRGIFLRSCKFRVQQLLRFLCLQR